MTKIKKLIALGGVIAGVAFLASCSADSAVIWASHVKSPDGSYQANAETIQQGGPGNAALFTRVKLSQRQGDEGIEILGLSHESAQELINGAVSMTWVGSNRLRLEYVPSSRVDFQAIKSSGVEIDTQPRSR
jgi:hypothetical protein